MKRSLLIIILIAALGVLLAVESDPSATVGYFKKSIASNTWDTVSLPFNYVSLSPDSVFGTQFLDGDVIQDVSTGDNWTFYTGFGWFPSNEFNPNLALGAAYWIYRYSDNPNLDYYILGVVDPQPVTVLVNANGWSCFSLNECRPVNPDLLPIVGMLEGDVIQDVGTGDNWTYYDGFGWFPSNEFVVTLEPTHSYWFYTTSLTGFSWTYTPPARGTVLAPPLPLSERLMKAELRIKK